MKYQLLSDKRVEELCVAADTLVTKVSKNGRGTTLDMSSAVTELLMKVITEASRGHSEAMLGKDITIGGLEGLLEGLQNGKN